MYKYDNHKIALFLPIPKSDLSFFENLKWPEIYM